MLSAEVTEWLAEYKGLSNAEVNTFASTLATNDRLILDLFTLFETPPFHVQELDPVCHQLYEFYRSKEAKLKLFSLQFVATLVWLYLRCLSNGDKKMAPSGNAAHGQHECRECGKSFTRLSNLTRHRKMVHNKKIHVCSLCSHPFTDGSNLNRYVKNDHTPPVQATCSVASSALPVTKTSASGSSHQDFNHSTSVEASTSASNHPGSPSLYDMAKQPHMAANR